MTLVEADAMDSVELEVFLRCWDSSGASGLRVPNSMALVSTKRPKTPEMKTSNQKKGLIRGFRTVWGSWLLLCWEVRLVSSSLAPSMIAGRAGHPEQP